MLLSKNPNGFTLVEVLVAMVLIGVIMATVSSFFITSLNLFDRGTRQAEVQQQARNAMLFLRQDLNAAVDVEVNDEELSANEIVEITQRDGKEIIYKHVEDQLIRSIDNSNNGIALNITKISVNDEGNRMYTIEVVAGEQDIEVELETTVKARGL